MFYLLLTWLVFPFLWLRSVFKKNQPVRKVLVIQTAKIGDFVATTPVFSVIRQALPQVEITALLHAINEPLAKNLPFIDKLEILPPEGYKGWAGKVWLVRLLSRGYDATVVLSPNMTTFLVPLWAGIPRRVSVLPDRRRGTARLAWPMLTHGEQHQSGTLFRDTALKSLSGLGVQVSPALLAVKPDISRTLKGDEQARATLHGFQKPLIGLGLGAGNRMKALALEQWLEITRSLLDRSVSILVLVGTVADTAVAQELLSKFDTDRLIDTTGQWTLENLPSLLGSLDCFVGVDSGATYIADALGIPVVDYMGPADADDQRPLGPRAIVIKSDEPCAPCSHSFDAPYTCKIETVACLKKAPLKEIYKSTLDILRK